MTNPNTPFPVIHAVLGGVPGTKPTQLQLYIRDAMLILEGVCPLCRGGLVPYFHKYKHLEEHRARCHHCIIDWKASCQNRDWNISVIEVDIYNDRRTDS
jgi:hypothetical protein